MKCLFLLFPCLLFAKEETSLYAKRIYAHLAIHDAASAIKEAKLALKIFPQSKELQRAFITSLCEKGEEVEALRAWKSFAHTFKEEKNSAALLENLAWGVLRRADHSNQWFVRLYALIGAALTHDARALPLLLDALRDTNASLRTVAVRLSTNMRDQLLQEELLRLLSEERSWQVRLEVIRAIGQMKMKCAKERLKEIAADRRATCEEKQAAITSLVQLFDYASHDEVKRLITSDHSGLRELACEIISYFELSNEIGVVIPLLEDASSSVRVAAINCLGLLGIRTSIGKIKECLTDAAHEVAITAAWALALFDEDVGIVQLKRWLRGRNPTSMRLAAGAVATLGKRGVALAHEIVKETKDPYVSVTLSRGLIGQRAHVKRAADTLFSVLNQETKELWMWESNLNPLFRYLGPSTLWHTEELANYPYLIDQLIRLDLLSVLTFVKHPKAIEAVKKFLQHQRSHVVGAAATVLLELGDEESLKLVRELLDAKEDKIRFQAALTIALFGKDSKAISVLQEMYLKLDHLEKLQVLEALAHIGDPISIPFFIERLGEPHQTLRVAAASALMQALYH